MEDTKHLLDILRQDPESDVSQYISKYQLRATLLDPVIPECLFLLTSSYLTQPKTAQLRTIYVFCRVRGFKTILQHFPTDAHLLIALRDNLSRSNDANWDSHYTLLLWLAAVALSPFELDLLEPGLFTSLYRIAMTYLGKSGVQRDAASLLMARLLTRSESKQSMLTDRFVNDFQITEDSNSFASIGKLQVLAAIMDRVSTIPTSVRALLEEAERRAMAEHQSEPWYFNSTLTLRLWIKIMGRTALRDLESFAELALSELIQLFDDNSSQVRMAAAKYVARIAKAMNPEAREEVLEAIFESLETDNIRYASPDYWNGALIAIAEMLRQSFFLDETTVQRLVVNVLAVKGLHFVQPTLRKNIGANVRDAACYVCWSLFRSREAQLTHELRATLYSSLICLACLDNEVNIRRAAAAALQEGLGRYGASAGDMTAVEMFRLIEKMNVHSVTLLKSCYEELAPQFSEQADFLRFYVVHGVNSASPEIRRAAAHAAPLLRGCTQGLIDALVDGQFVPREDLSQHGKLLVLGVLASKFGSGIYRAEDLKAMIDSESVTGSELVAEGMLHLLNVDPSQAAPVLRNLLTDEWHVIRAAEELVTRLPQAQLIDEIVPLCSYKMQESLLFVSCLLCSYKRLRSKRPELVELVLRATRLSDPRSRALAVKSLENTSDDFVKALTEAMNDYSVDERGDVGAWVREAAIERIVELSSASAEWITDAMRCQLWRMASESRQKLRLISSSALYKLGFIARELNTSDSSKFYLSLLQQCPVYMRPIVAAGLASSIGAARASLATIDGSLAGTLSFLNEKHFWILTEIIQLDRISASRIFEVNRTLKRITLSGFDIPEELLNRCLAIAYNTTLNPGLSEQTVLDAIDCLQVYAMQNKIKARERLVSLLKKHRNGRIRQRAADALVELGIENDILETTDWTRRDFVQYARKLSI